MALFRFVLGTCNRLWLTEMIHHLIHQLDCTGTVASIWNCWKYKKFFLCVDMRSTKVGGFKLALENTNSSCVKKQSTSQWHSRKLTNLLPYDMFYKTLTSWLSSVEHRFLQPKADEIWWCVEDFWIFSCHWSWLEKQVTHGKCLCDSERIFSSVNVHYEHVLHIHLQKTPLDKGRHSKRCEVNHSWSLSCLNGVVRKYMEKTFWGQLVSHQYTEDVTFDNNHFKVGFFLILSKKILKLRR